MDVVTAFLNVEVESDIYMEQPQGHITTPPDGTRLVCHLKKALYGIREAPKAWNALLTAWLVSYGFSRSLVDPGVFTAFYEKLLYILAVYVDESILVGKRGKFITEFKAALASRFEIEDLGPATWLLGCKIGRDRDKKTLEFGQEQYATKVIEEFGMSSSSHVGTPMASNAVSKPRHDEPLDTKLFPFPTLIGKLLYLSNCTRLDIADTVNHLSRYMSKYTVQH